TGVHAAVTDWTTPTTLTTKSVTTLSFQPNVVLHFGDYDTNASLPSMTTDAGFMFGAMSAGGDQWANTFYAKDAAASTTTATARAQLSGNAAAIVGINSAGTKTLQAVWYSPGMLSNGFEVNFTANTTSSAYRFFSLALAGVNLNTGTFSRPTGQCNPCSGVTTLVSGLGFTPSAVLFSNVANPTTASFPVA